MISAYGGDCDGQKRWSHRTWAIVAAAGGVFAVSVVLMMVTEGGAVSPSRDAGAAEQPLWMLLVPIALAGALAAVIPRRAPSLPAARGPRGVLLKRLWLLIGLAVVFPLLVGLGQLGNSVLYMALKVALFLLVPAVALPLLRHRSSAVAMPSVLPRTGWQWWAPLPALITWGVVSYWGPLARPVPSMEQYPDPVYLAVAAILTFLTASVGEEIFYRYLLQSHLEAVLGRWNGILLSALLFAAMHLPTHGAEEPMWRAYAGVIAYQGVSGVLYGYLWTRYRNLWAPIAMHGAVNGMPIILYFATQP